MVKIKKIIIIFPIFYFLFSILTVQAALVPCGTSTTHSCTWCDFGALIQNIIKFMMYLIFPLAAVMIVVGGIMIMTAAGSTERVAKGRGIITAAITGLLIALFSWLILDTLIKYVAVEWGNPEYGFPENFGPWNKIQCNP